jgi:hypothetical protein
LCHGCYLFSSQRMRLTACMAATSGCFALSNSEPAPAAVKAAAAKNEQDDEDDQKCGAIHGSLLTEARPSSLARSTWFGGKPPMKSKGSVPGSKAAQPELTKVSGQDTAPDPHWRPSVADRLCRPVRVWRHSWLSCAGPW